MTLLSILKKVSLVTLNANLRNVDNKIWFGMVVYNLILLVQVGLGLGEVTLDIM